MSYPQFGDQVSITGVVDGLSSEGEVRVLLSSGECVWLDAALVYPHEDPADEIHLRISGGQ